MNKFILQGRLLYAIIVAGKSAKFANAALGRFIAHKKKGELPFDLIRRLGPDLRATLQHARTGNYTKLTRAFGEVVDLDPATCTLEDLEGVYGIGPKTSRFFLMLTRPGMRYAVLDVHILRWLRKRGHDVPKNTPQSLKQYAHIEQIFLQEADTLGLEPQILDSIVWESERAGS